MKTTKKQFVNFAIGLIKEISNQNKNKNIKVEYRVNSIYLWFHYYDEDSCECIRFYSFDTLRENKARFKIAILKIKGFVS
ncbi:MAG: hypothetical protein ACEQSQ_11730 [Candidatus Paceibacteria bacterium]